jgi:hypothetical protein
MPDRALKALPATSAPVVQFDFEEDVLGELHRMPSAEEEGLSEKEQTARTGKLRERVQRLHSRCSKRRLYRSSVGHF